jgi:thiosulfate/3-mercaptopyruvate sulfurtransferase
MLKLISIDDFEDLVRQNCVDVLLDARPLDELRDGFIPGAQHFPWEEWNEEAPQAASAILHEPGYWGKLADPVATDVAARLTKRGISNDSHIVIYADGMRSKGREGRIAWMLLYFGAKNVSILNGGWRAWARSHRIPVNTKQAERPFVLQLDERRRAHQADIATAEQLIDTRGTREFAGRIYDYQPRLGHIPGALNFPYRSLMHSNGVFIGRDEYLARARQNGVIPQPIWYCEVGVRAAMMSLLNEIYTGEVTRVYDASFMEWAFDPALPVESENLSVSI